MNCIKCGNKVIENYEEMLCATCNRKKRVSPQTQLKRKRISPVSVKRKKKLEEYVHIRNKFLEENPICERCGDLAIDVHHTKGRLGTNLTDTQYFKSVCRTCHTYIEEHPEWALLHGFRKSRLAQ